MIAQASVQEVLQRADIVEIIGLSVRLKKRGSNYVANCPFHNEKTPSFSVSASKGFYKCFGCGRSGNVITFVEEHEKLGFVESIRWLADYYKIELQESERSPEQIQSQQAEEALRILNEFAADFFSERLCHSEEGKNIGLSYFHERGLRQETIDTFRLGYCDESDDSFYQEAKSKNYSPELLEKSGLIRERYGQYQDSYRGRVIFPIQGNTGRVLGFGARIIKNNDKAPKYVNTPENELYIKSRVLYGLYQARQTIGKLNECLLVEGYLDVISLHQAGIRHAVASSGTSLTEEQLRAIGHITKNLNILYDADPAGIKAALRGIDLALSQGFRVHLVLLPEGEDPDSFVQKQGKSGFEAYVAEHKQDVIHFRAALGLKEAAGDPLKKNTLVNEIAETISRVNKAEDFSLRQHYIREASSILEVDEGGLVILVNKYLHERLDAAARTQKNRAEPIPNEAADTSTEPAISQALPTPELQEWALIRLLLECGSLPLSEGKNVADEIAERVDPTLIETQLARRMYDEYFSHATGMLPPQVIAFFISHPDPAVQRQTASLLHHRDEVSPNWKAMHDIELPDIDKIYLADADSTLCYFELKMLEKTQEQVMQKIKTEGNGENISKLQMMYMELARVKQDIVSKRGTVTLHQPLK